MWYAPVYIGATITLVPGSLKRRVILVGSKYRRFKRLTADGIQVYSPDVATKLANKGVPVTSRVDEDTVEEFDKIAARLRITRGELVRYLCECLVESPEAADLLLSFEKTKKRAVIRALSKKR